MAGQINAGSEEQARKELHRIGFSVLTVREAEKDLSLSEGMRVFEFEGFDKEGKLVKGTIEGSDRLPVYRRLREEYHFKVSYLCERGAKPEEKQRMRGEGLEELKGLYEKRIEKKKGGGIFGGVKGFFNKIKKWGTDSEEEKKKKEEKKKEEFLKQIDEAINKAKNFLKEQGDKLKVEEQKNVRVKMDELVRVRNSKNEQHIKKIAEELLGLIKKYKEELKLKVEEDEDKIKVRSMDLGDEEKRADEDMADYLTRLEGVYKGMGVDELGRELGKEVKRLITKGRKRETWKRLWLKNHYYWQKRREELEKKMRKGEDGEEAIFEWVGKEVHAVMGILLFMYVLVFVFAGVLVSKEVEWGRGVTEVIFYSWLYRIMMWTVAVIYVGGWVRGRWGVWWRWWQKLGFWLVLAGVWLVVSVNV